MLLCIIDLICTHDEYVYLLNKGTGHIFFKIDLLNSMTEREGFSIPLQYCQMVYFQTILGVFWRALEQTMLVYFGDIWNTLQPFGLFHDHLEYFGVIW
jgi:hypothetical protein